MIVRGPSGQKRIDNRYFGAAINHQDLRREVMAGANFKNTGPSPRNAVRG